MVNQCAHPSCTCLEIQGAQGYCSDYCSKAEGADDDGACMCGHEQCEGSEQAETEVGLET